MSKSRTNLSISHELRQALAGVEANWSEVAEAALWRVTRGETLEAEALRLRRECTELRERLRRIAALATAE